MIDTPRSPLYSFASLAFQLGDGRRRSIDYCSALMPSAPVLAPSFQTLRTLSHP